jgi:hypothetical protein
MAVSDQDVESRRLHLRLGLFNGLLIGLALALGVWAFDAIVLAASHVRWIVYPGLFLGSLALVLMGGLAGWLAAWVGRSWASLLIWLATGSLMMFVIGHVPYEGRTLTIWLVDPRAWGLPVYPFDEAAGTGVALAGFFTLLLFGILGLLQSYRLEGIAGETDDRGRPHGPGWLLLLLPLPLVVAVGLINDDMVNRPLRVAPQLVHEAIRTGRTYSGDLFELSLEKGVNYNAISAVRDQMSEGYTLSIGDVDLGVGDTVFVIADFDNGAWIRCRVLADQLSFCYDASLPYLQGLPVVVATGQMPEDCPQCTFVASGEQRAWLHARRDMLGPSPRFRRLAQWGGFVLIQAESGDGEYVMQCLFEGASPVQLQRCWEGDSRAAASAIGVAALNPPPSPVENSP